MISPCILVICIELRWRQLCSDPVAPCLRQKRIVIVKPLETGCDTHNKPNSARMLSSGRTDLFSQKPPARLQVMAFLAVELDQCFCRSCCIMQCKASRDVSKLSKWLRIKNWEMQERYMTHGSAVRLMKSVVYSPAAQNSVNSVKEVRNRKSVIKKETDAFRNDDSASFRRVTPSTQVGRLSGSHSDTGFQLTQLPRWEGWRWNSMAKSPRNCRCFNKGCFP